MKNKKWINDIVLIAVVLFVGIGLYLLFTICIPQGNYAQIYIDGELYDTISLQDNCEKTLPTGHKVCIKDGKANVEYAPCEEQICAHHSQICREGESIICLPYNVVVTIVSGGDVS